MVPSEFSCLLCFQIIAQPGFGQDARDFADKSNVSIPHVEFSDHGDPRITRSANAGQQHASAEGQDDIHFHRHTSETGKQTTVKPVNGHTRPNVQRARNTQTSFAVTRPVTTVPSHATTSGTRSEADKSHSSRTRGLATLSSVSVGEKRRITGG